jgi:hypothetical protein
MAEENSAITDGQALVALLYRAGPAELCLTANIRVRSQEQDGIRLTDVVRAARRPDLNDMTSDGAAEDDDEDEDGDRHETGRARDGLRRLLTCPGGRYRVEDAATSQLQYVSDGTSHWALLSGGEEAVRVPSSSLAGDFLELLEPSWLLGYFTLTAGETVQAAGRPAHRATGIRRPVTSVQAAHGDRGYRRFDRVELLIDAELGILLRLEAFTGAEQVQLSEVRSLDLRPALEAGPAQFHLPPGTLEAADTAGGLGSWFDLSSPGWRAVRTAAGTASGAADFTIRRPGPDPAAPPMPAFGPAPSPAIPAGDELINLLYRTGLAPQRFAASGLHWTNGELMHQAIRRVQEGFPGPLAGLVGPDGILAALAGRPPGDTFGEIRLRMALPDRYRVDRVRGGRGKTEAVGSDGDQGWALYPNRVVTTMPVPLGDGWDTVADLAWLLRPDWQLSAGGAEEISGRRGWRVWASYRAGHERTDHPGFPSADTLAGFAYEQATAVVDAELGIALQLAFLSGGQPVSCWELRDFTAAPAGDDSAFGRPELLGRRLVEGDGPLAHLDIPEPLRAAGKAGRAGAALLSGLLSQRTGPPRENPRDVWDDASDD